MATLRETFERRDTDNFKIGELNVSLCGNIATVDVGSGCVECVDIVFEGEQINTDKTLDAICSEAACQGYFITPDMVI